MENNINFKFEDIYTNMDEKDEKNTKKLLDEPSSTIDADPFCCSYFLNYLSFLIYRITIK